MEVMTYPSLEDLINLVFSRGGKGRTTTRHTAWNHQSTRGLRALGRVRSTISGSHDGADETTELVTGLLYH